MSELVINNGVWSDTGMPCGCSKGPLPELALNYSTDDGGATIAKIVAKGTDHSFDPKGLPPLRIGGSGNSTDAQYGTSPRMRASVDEEQMSDEDLRRIGLAGGNGEPLETPRLAFKKDATGQTVSEVV